MKIRDARREHPRVGARPRPPADRVPRRARPVVRRRRREGNKERPGDAIRMRESFPADRDPTARGGNSAERRGAGTEDRGQTLVSVAWSLAVLGEEDRQGRRAPSPRAGATSARGAPRAAAPGRSRASTRTPTPTASRRAAARKASQPIHQIAPVTIEQHRTARVRRTCPPSFWRTPNARGRRSGARRWSAWYRPTSRPSSRTWARGHEDARARGTAWICSCRGPWGSRWRSPGGGGGGGRAQPLRATAAGALGQTALSAAPEARVRHQRRRPRGGAGSASRPRQEKAQPRDRMLSRRAGLKRPR